MTVLITGASGFVGRHLLEFLRCEHPQVEVLGLARHPGPGLVAADLEQADAVEAIFDTLRPERIVHLAAQSSPQRSWDEPERTLATNVLGLLNLLEAVRRRALDPLVLVVGSGEEYGAAPADELPLHEQSPLRPLTPYAVSKVAQSFLAQQYTLSKRVRTIRTRTFNHTGPGRGERFAESSFARQLCQIERAERAPVLEVGNLEAVRDFCDVRDVVRAYWCLLERGEPGQVYNVCSGQGRRLRDVLARLVELSGQNVDVRVDPQRLRPADIPALVGDPRQLAAATGWSPRVDFDDTLRDLLADWRRRLDSHVPERPADDRAPS